MSRAIRSEWTKLRTSPGTVWLLLGIVVATIGLTALVGTSLRCRSGGCGWDPAKVSLAGIQLGQALVVILAALIIGGEYGTGMIRTSLTAVPRRIELLAAKATVLIGLVAVTGVVSVLGCLLLGRLILPGRGIAALSLSHGPDLRAVSGSVLYLVLIAVLSLGTATAVRQPATAVGIVLGLLYVLPIVTSVVSDPHWKRHLEQLSPMSAGLAIQATTGLSDLPLSPWAGLGVLAYWAAAAVLIGGSLLHWRDA